MINIYCDESCHLEHDNSDIMVLGALTCPSEKKIAINEDIRNIKRKYGLDSKIEIKWTKISNSKLGLYEELINYFFKNDDLKFRAVVAVDKAKLNHNKYNSGDPNLWYYKMYYLLLDKMCEIDDSYRVFIDVKDTNGGPRIEDLHRVLCSNKYDYKKDIIRSIDQVDSRRVDMLQLTDILIGAIGFYHRNLCNNVNNSKSKSAIVQKIIDNTNEYSIKHGTYRNESKFNIFIWTPNYCRG